MNEFLAIIMAVVAGTSAFAQSADAVFETKANDDGSVTITKYVGRDGGDITIPARINGYREQRVPRQPVYERCHAGAMWN
ncbi:MAG: hypothetical protein LBE74_03460 [Treponema sp.]|jgi:hypothetical protein|nr:hypothetical protein [Treponema sp.]